MSATGGEQSIEAILQLVLDGREGEALSAIGVEFGKSTAEELRFYETAVSFSGGKRDRFEKEREERRNRGRLANLYNFVGISDGERVLGKSGHRSRMDDQAFGRYGRALFP
jgi:hypothetical protein